MRGLALAEHVIARGGHVELAAIALDGALAARAAATGVQLRRPQRDLAIGGAADADWLADTAAAMGADWVVTDGYGFDADYQQRVHAADACQLVVDDYGHSERYCAELVLNQNLSATAAMYRERSAHTRLLLGPDYAMLRREFSATPPHAAPADRASRLLVTMGAADPHNTTARILAGIALVDDAALRVRVVVGPSNPRAAELRAQLNDSRIVLVDASQNMAEHMAWADMAVTAAGSTTYELCCMGVPSLVVVLADNQQPVARSLGQAGAAVELGWHHALTADAVATAIVALCPDRERRQALARHGRQLVDGRGCDRVVAALERGVTDRRSKERRACAS